MKRTAPWRGYDPRQFRTPQFDRSPLDPRFGDDGATLLSGHSFYRLHVQELTVDSNGYVYAGVTATHGDKSWHVGVARLTPDGQIDTTFGPRGDGLALVPIDAHATRATPVLYPDGRILLQFNMALRDPFIAPYVPMFIRFSPDGTIDPRFGSGGRFAPVLHGFHPLSSGGTDVAIADDGSITMFARGYRLNYEPNAFVIRVTESGHLDTGFHGTGFLPLLFPPPFSDLYPRAAWGTMLPDGRYLVVGEGSEFSFARRYDSDGNWDRTYGTDGNCILPFEGESPGTPASLSGVVFRDGGRFIAVGEVQSAWISMLAGIDAEGGADATFHGGEVVETPTYARGCLFTRCLPDANGSVTVAGTWETRVADTGGLISARYLGDGSLDLGYGDRGFTRIDGPGLIISRGAARQPGQGILHSAQLLMSPYLNCGVIMRLAGRD